eukprot:18926-Eustigmatos_ZCMA.PRE.1
MQGGQQVPHHRDDAAAALARQCRSSAILRATVLTTAELLMPVMMNLGGGIGGLRGRRYELGSIAL